MKPTTQQLEREARVVRALLAHGKPVLDRCLLERGGQCVIGTRAAVAVARANGLEAFPLVVTAYVFTPAIGERFLELTDRGEWPTTEQLKAWHDDPGGWSIGIGIDKAHRPGGFDVDADKWAGHLVAIVGRRWLVDLTLDQAERLHKELRVEPVAHRIPANIAEAFLRGRHPLIGRSDHGTVVAYLPRPADKSFRELPGWTRQDELTGLIGAVGDAVDQETAWPVRRAS